MVRIKPEPRAKRRRFTQSSEERLDPDTNTPATHKTHALIEAWRSIPKAWRVTISVAAGLTTLIVSYEAVMRVFDPSHTRFEVNTSDAKFLHPKVWNTGRSQSRLRGYRVRFPRELGVEDAVLTQAKGDTIIEAQPSAQVVDLTVTELIRRCNPGTKRRYLKTDIEAVLKAHGQSLVATVYVNVEESGHFFEIPRKPFVVEKYDQPTADLLTNFILGRMPDVDEDIPCQR